MTNSTNTPPPVDGFEELDEFLRDGRASPEPIQTDLEDFTGPTPQPAAASKLAVESESRPPASKTNNKNKQKKNEYKEQKSSNGQTRKNRSSRSRVEKEQQPAGQEDQPASPNAKHAHQAVAAADNVEDADAPGITASPTTVDHTASAPLPPPRPLGLILSPATTPPVQALGKHLATVVAAADRLVQAPVAMIISSLLSILALIAQGHVNVRQLHGGTSPVSLFLLTLGDSGMRKTTVDRKMTRGAEWAEEALRDAAEADMPIELFQRVIRTGTVEGMLRVLKNGAGSAAIFNDDAGSFFGGSAMNAENRMKTTAWLSQVWDGSTINHVLADGDRTIFMAGRRLSAHLAIQPTLFLPMLADASLMHQGILGRFLVTAPNSNIGYRKIRMPDPADEKIVDVFAAEVRDRLIAGLPYRESSQELKPRDLDLSDDAWEMFATYADEVEIAQRAFGPYVELTGPASKFAENAIRIAGVLAFFEDPDVAAISKNTAGRAIELMRFYAAEMVRLVGAARQSPLLTSAQRVLRWLLESGDQTVRFQDFYQLGPLRSASENRVIVQVLEHHGWLNRVAGNGYAGASDIWAIVPRPSAEEMLGIPSSNVPPA
jgi:hypothetical protein